MTEKEKQKAIKGVDEYGRRLKKWINDNALESKKNTD